MVEDVPVPRSYPQQLGAMLDAATTRLGVKRLKVGGGPLSTLEAAAQNDVRNTQDVFNLLAAQDLDNTSGVALDQLGGGEKVPRFLLLKATGTVTISDTSFTKLSSKLFQGAAAPIVGSVVLNVEDASLFTASGDVYVGRGTTAVEGPLHYSSKVDNGTYWTLNLTTPTTRFHNRGEAVVLAQGGNRVIDAGTLVATAQGSLAAAVQFSTVFEYSIPDGETSVTDVRVVCTSPGAIGNAPAESIKEFPGGNGPFPGAAVINPGPYTTGRDTETDNDYRDRIRQVRNSRQRGTDLALETAVLGISSETEQKRVSSARLVRRTGRPSVLYIDDGSGYEEQSSGVGIEVVVDAASGGETEFRTLGRPVTKAFLRSTNTAPFSLVDGMKLAVNVGGTTYSHAFDASEFTSISAASAYEVVASINADPSIGFSARTIGAGAGVVLFARTEANEDLQVVAVSSPDSDAGPAFLFPASRRYTALLYRDDRLLSKDGRAAVIRSRPFALWNGFSGTQTVTLAVDTTPAVTYSISDQDFIDAATGYTGVGRNSLAAWAAVLNRKLPGVTTTVEADLLVLTSNKGHSSSAGLTITGGDLVTNNVLPLADTGGAAFDFTLDRGTGDIVLEQPLSSGARLTLGTTWTRAFLETSGLGPTTLASDGTLYFVVDGNPVMVEHGVGAATPLTASVGAVTPAGFRVNLTATSSGEAFADVGSSDWLVLYDPDTDLPTTLRNAWRVVETSVITGLRNRVAFEKRALNAPRAGFTATALTASGGQPSVVLAAGGYTTDVGPGPTDTDDRTGTGVTETCELFTHATGLWTYTGSMSTPRTGHTATLLGSGKVLVTGGTDATGTALASTEVYDPGTGLWTAGPVMAVARTGHSATMLASGRVLIVGGRNGVTASSSSQEYDPAGSGSFVNAGVLNTARYGHGALRIPAGSGTHAQANNVIVAGGQTTGSTRLASVERYDIGTHAWTAMTAMSAARAHFGFEAKTSDILVALGDGDGGSNDGSYALYTVTDATGSWGADTAIAGWSFRNKPLVKVPGTGDLIALYGTETGTARCRHKKYDISVPAWVDVADSLFLNCGVEKRGVGVVVLGGTGADTVFACGGVTTSNADTGSRGFTTAHHEQLNDTTATWSWPDSSATLSAGTLGARGLAFIRTANRLLKGTVSAGTNYTAPTFVAALNAALDGATATVYRTSRVRVATNSYGAGSVLLAASTISGPTPSLPDLLPLPSAVVETNLVGHLGSVESGGRGVGTPLDWQVYQLLYATAPHVSDVTKTAYLEQVPAFALTTTTPPTGTVVGLRRWGDGLNPAHWSWASQGDDRRLAEHGNTKALRSAVGTLDVLAGTGTVADKIRVGLRTTPFADLVPHAPVVLASPYAFGSQDDLTVVVDQDTDTKRFVVPLYRKVASSNGTYAAQLPLKDADSAGATLATAFGLSYDFNDFAVMMKARAKSHSADATRRILWRWFRHGADGNLVTLRYMYPAAASAAVSVTVTAAQDSIRTNLGGPVRLNVDVVLGSGAARAAPPIRAATKLAFARCNGSTTTKVWDVYAILGYSVVQGERLAAGAHTRLRLQVPNNGVVAQGPQSSGINVGDILWFDASVPTSTTLLSGSFVVEQVDAFNAGTGTVDVYVPPNTLHDGSSAWVLAANPGTLSFDPSGKTLWNVATVANDIFNVTGAVMPLGYHDNPMRVVATGQQYLRLTGLDLSDTGASTTPVWTTIGDITAITTFAPPSQTATAVAAAVNALASDVSTCPVTAVITGSGNGAITKASWDELGSATSGYPLADGINYVQRTVNPPNLATQTEFLLRAPITADLTSNADFSNEDIRLVPILTSDVVAWLNSPAVTGLWTAAEIVASSDGTKVQLASLTPGSAGAVEVQGGLGDVAAAAVFGSAADVPRTTGPSTSIITVRRAEAMGWAGGAYLRFDNTAPVSKTAFWDGTTTAAVTVDGLWSFSTTPYSILAQHASMRLEVETVGDYTALHFPFQPNEQSVDASDFVEGGYIYLTGRSNRDSDLSDLPTANRGVFTVIRATTAGFGTTVWVENSNAVEGVYEADMVSLGADSAVPGDEWVVSSDRFGTTNRRTWRITEVGAATPGAPMYTTDAWRVEVTSGSAGAVASTLISPDTDLVQLRQGAPGRYFKKILTVAPNQTDGSYVDVQLDSFGGTRFLSATAGTVATALDKLAFEPGLHLGVDGYGFSTGLIGEANRVVYGDPDDEATYPGYAAAGASILTSGPLVKRIKVALALRVQSGLETADLADAVKSAVAAVINQTAVGGNRRKGGLPISGIVTAAGSVTGVEAVSVIAPTYSSSRDIIPLAANEKPLVLSLDDDVTIAFVGA